MAVFDGIDVAERPHIHQTTSALTHLGNDGVVGDEWWFSMAAGELSAWEATGRLIAEHQRSDTDAADSARSLAHLLYDKAAGLGLNDDGVAYNDLVNAWAHLHTIDPPPPQFGFDTDN